MHCSGCCCSAHFLPDATTPLSQLAMFLLVLKNAYIFETHLFTKPTYLTILTSYLVLFYNLSTLVACLILRALFCWYNYFRGSVAALDHTFHDGLWKSGWGKHYRESAKQILSCPPCLTLLQRLVNGGKPKQNHNPKSKFWNCANELLIWQSVPV